MRHKSCIAMQGGLQLPVRAACTILIQLAARSEDVHDLYANPLIWSSCVQHQYGGSYLELHARLCWS